VDRKHSDAVYTIDNTGMVRLVNLDLGVNSVIRCATAVGLLQSRSIRLFLKCPVSSLTWMCLRSLSYGGLRKYFITPPPHPHCGR